MRGCIKRSFFFKAALVATLLTTLPVLTFAQGDPPADGCDPYDGCDVPLDTWVIVLVAIAIIYGAYHLYKKQNSLSAQ